MSTRHQTIQAAILFSVLALIVITPVAVYQIGSKAAVVAAVFFAFIFVIIWVYRPFKSCFDAGFGHDLSLPGIQKNEIMFRNAFDLAAIGMALVSPARKFVKVNRALAKILGCNVEYLVNGNLFSVVKPDDADMLEKDLTSLLDGKAQSTSSELRFYRKNRAVRWIRLSASLVRDSANKPTYFIFQFDDITDRREDELRLRRNTLYDPLTDLPNRFLFLDRLQVAVTRLRREPNGRLTVIQVDFDRFKLINDRFGQQAGDAMLSEAAQRLRKMLRASNTVARIGADEFALFVEDGSFEEILSIVERIRQELSRPFDVEGELCYLTVSVGIAVGSAEYESPEFLLRDANTALKQAKRSGRDRYEIFVDEMHSSSIEFLRTETDLRYALERGEFRLFFNPSSLSKRARLPASNRWYAGIIRSAGSSRRSSSSRSPRVPE